MRRTNKPTEEVRTDRPDAFLKLAYENGYAVTLNAAEHRAFIDQVANRLGREHGSRGNTGLKQEELQKGSQAICYDDGTIQFVFSTDHANFPTVYHDNSLSSRLLLDRVQQASTARLSK